MLHPDRNKNSISNLQEGHIYNSGWEHRHQCSEATGLALIWTLNTKTVTKQQGTQGATGIKPSKASVPCVYACGSFYWAPEQAASLLVPMKAPAMPLMPAAASLADLANVAVATQQARKMAAKTRPRQKQAACLEVSTLRRAALLMALTRTVSLLMVLTNKALKS